MNIEEHIEVIFDSVLQYDNSMKVYNYTQAVSNMNLFFRNTDKTRAFVKLGTRNPGHATLLYIHKLDQYVEFVYINTGYGIDHTYDSVIYDDVKFYNLYKILNVKYENLDLFLKKNFTIFIRCICRYENSRIFCSMYGQMWND